MQRHSPDQMMHLEVNGCILRYEIGGREGAPWVTLSHGVATDLTLWDRLMPFLASNYRVLRYDVRGHGGSPPDGDYSLDLLARDVVGLLDGLGIRRTHFLGLSMGGMVGLGLALDHPHRLFSAVICDALASATDAYRKAWAARIEQVQANGIEAIVEPSLARWFTPGFKDRDRAGWEHARAMIRNTSVAGYCGSGAALQELDYGRRLAEIRVPTLFLVGQDDQGAPPSEMLAMHKETPQSRFVCVPNAGHLSVMERPEYFATSVLGFLSEVQAGEQGAAPALGSD